MLINMKPYVSLPFSGEYTPYTLGITTSGELIDQKRNLVELLPGHQISVTVIPQLVSTDDNFDSLTLYQRKCKFSHETDELPLKMIKEYTRVGCELECAAKKATVLCKCMPWYYPNYDENKCEVPVCDMFGGKCFEEIMSNEKYYKMCPDICQQDCRGMSMSVVTSYIKINSDDFCNEGSFMDQLFKESAKQLLPFEHYKLLANDGDLDLGELLSSNADILQNNDLQIMSDLKNKFQNTEEILHNLEESLKIIIEENNLIGLENMNKDKNQKLRESLKTKEKLQSLKENEHLIGLEDMKGGNKEWRKSLCKQFVEKYVTLVSVESPTNTVGHTVRDIRDSLIEKLGIIGGTIGLFTGFSLLSLLEIIFVSITIYNQCFKKNAVDVDDNELDDKETGPRRQSPRRRSTLDTTNSSHHEWEYKFNEIIQRVHALENISNVTLPDTLPYVTEEDDVSQTQNLTSKKPGDIGTGRNTQDYEKDKVNQ